MKISGIINFHYSKDNGTAKSNLIFSLQISNLTIYRMVCVIYNIYL